ncbi:MFS transporter [Streptomyces sp. NPDC055134]
MSTTEPGATLAPHITEADVAARIERLPKARWQVRSRLAIGVATFFDAFDALSVAYVMPVLAPLWGLDAQQISLAISIGFVGQLVGALTSGAVAERYGRVPAATVSVLVFAFASLALVFSPGYVYFLIVRFVQGVGLGAEVPVAATYIAEITGAHRRGRFVLLYELVFPAGLLVAALAGYWIVPHLGWEWMFVLGAAPALLALYFRRKLPESPRWLQRAGRHGQADRVLNALEAATRRETGRELPAPVPVRSAGTPQRASLADLFGGRYRRRTFVVWVIWFSAYLTTYGLTAWLPSIYRTVYGLSLGDALLYSLVTTAAGLLGAALCAFTVDLVGRRVALAAGLLTGGALLLVLAALGAGDAPQVLLWSALAYAWVNAAALGVYLYTPELYPTRVRSFGVGIASAWLRVASILGPFVVSTAISGTGHVTNAFLVFGAVAVAGGLVTALFAVETRNKVLEEFCP